jgi:transcriptional regulator with XRE-family HTH domain
MKNNEWLRKQTDKYLKSRNAISQSELERRVGFGKGTISKFIKGMELKIDHEKYRKLVDIIAPWEYDILVAAGKLKEKLMKDWRSKKEIAIIASKMAGSPRNDESIVP